MVGRQRPAIPLYRNRESKQMSITVLLRSAPNTDLSGFLPKPTSIGDTVTEASEELWKDTGAGNVSTGIWEATPGRFSARRDGFHEICYLISGRATLTTDEGEAVEVGTGDLFVTPAGWVGTWEVHETVRKAYVIVGSA